MRSINPKLEPLMHELKKCGIGAFLSNIEFNRLMIEKDYQEIWQQAFDTAVGDRHFISSMSDSKGYYSENALCLILNTTFLDDKVFFDEFLVVVLTSFFQRFAIADDNYNNIKKDLKILGIKEANFYIFEAIIANEKSKKISNNNVKNDAGNIVDKSKNVNKIFISHSSKDKILVDNFVQTILRLALEIQKEDIFCSSIEGMGIRSGRDFRDCIKREISDATIVILFLSHHYKSSEICLNEMGAAWVLCKDVIPLLIPPLKYTEIGALHITDHVDIIDTAAGLDSAIHSIRLLLTNLKSIDVRNLNRHRDDFLLQIKKMNVSGDIEPAKDQLPAGIASDLVEPLAMVKRIFNVSNNNMAKLLYHIGSNELSYRTQDTLIKRTALTAEIIDEIVTGNPLLFHRSRSRTSGKVIYRLTESARVKFKSIKFD